ncbi:hypothetical protein Pcinc_024739 [Petrolisthes cinctipes]|uniref:Uncharacterized protein n=1 Tax=Petrolisthes cinctipes TaxID=88211 RepID=A0AAE1KD32_PETCI|nr:hypothetical protein Pcinc_024739 [Petrolisthes cinctipes]
MRKGVGVREKEGLYWFRVGKGVRVRDEEGCSWGSGMRKGVGVRVGKGMVVRDEEGCSWESEMRKGVGSEMRKRLDQGRFLCRVRPQLLHPGIICDP